MEKRLYKNKTNKIKASYIIKKEGKGVKKMSPMNRSKTLKDTTKETEFLADNIG